MNFRELMMPFILALATSLALQYFFFNKDSSAVPTNPQAGESFVAPKYGNAQQSAGAAQALQKPLNIEVDFIDKKYAKKPESVTVNTSDAHYVFSTGGASLQQVEFKRNWGGKQGYLATIFPPAYNNREQLAFLLAFDSATPILYDFLGKKEEQDRTIVKFKSDTEQAIVEKQFTVFHNEHRVALDVTIAPKAGVTILPRLLFPAPMIAELGQKDVINGLSSTPKNSLAIAKANEELFEKFWLKPTLFGAEDRYFIHALVADTNYFVQRGYYKLGDLNTITVILEGPEVVEKGSWHFEFFIGPKELSAVNAVDTRLEPALNYGYLAFISRPVSRILLGALNYIYEYVKNYGLAIILLTVLLKLLMLPLTWRAEKSQQKAQEFSKKMKHIEAKYKNDSQALAQARADLLRTHGFPLGGCLPLLLPLPLFIAFNWVIANSIELYMAPFGWIHDLSAPDPYYILPVFTALSVAASAMLMPAQKNNQGISSLGFALLLGAISTTFSAGVALFVVTNASLHALQTYLLAKKK